MKKLVKIESVLSLTQAIRESFNDSKGYQPYSKLKSHEGDAMYDSYLYPQKHIASCLTNQRFKISFVGKTNKDECPMIRIFEDYE